MEQIIAKHCSSGKLGQYRYPVHYRKGGQGWKTTGLADVSMKDVQIMHYKFGAHRMDIGKALIEIMEFLEPHISDKEFPFDQYDDEEDI